MNVNLKALTLSVILIAGVGMTPAFGQMEPRMTDPIMVTTDKESYTEGEKILVTGTVRDLLSGVPVSLQVTAENGNIVAVAQITVGLDKKFSTELAAGGQVMKFEGTYTVSVLYGNESRTAKTTFEFGGSTMTAPPPQEDVTYPVMIGDMEHTVTYSITGGHVLSIESNMDAKSLLINIEATDDGSLVITLPRSIIDALDGGETGSDIEYLVLVDGEQSDDVEETKTPSSRTLTIQFHAGAETIEIIGSWIVPEFGAIAAMILAVAIISIIAISARSRLSIMPRY